MGILCQLSIQHRQGHIALLIILQLICYLLTTIPLIIHYKLLYIDHKNKETADDNACYIDAIRTVIFIVFIQSIFEIIFVCVFLSDSRVSGFALIFVLLIRTTSIYCIFTETKSYKFIYMFCIRMFVCVWNKASPIDEAVEIDPNYRWYHKTNTMTTASDVRMDAVMNEKIKSTKSTEALSSGDLMAGTKNVEEVEVVIEMFEKFNHEFNSENSINLNDVGTELKDRTDVDKNE